MAQELLLGIKLGVSGAAAVGAAIGSMQSAMGRLGEVAKRLTDEQKRLGDAIERHMGRLAPATLAAINRDYEKLGKTIDAVRARQEKLGAAMARREALAAQRQRLGGEVMGTYATAIAVGAPVIGAVREAAGFGDAIKDIAIVGELTAEEEKKLGASLRRVAIEVNQTAEDMARGVGLLIANGMDPKKAEQQARLLGRFTTSSRASFDDSAKMMVTFDQLGVEDYELAFSQASKAGKLGSFEVRDMAKWMPEIGGYLKAIGITGNEAVVNATSRLQIAKKTAGSSDEAANNFRNFLAKLTSPDTQKDFEKLGIDLQGSMIKLARHGLDPIEGAVGIILQKVGERAPEVTRELEELNKEIAAIKDPAERAAELERRRTMIEALGQRAGLGKMFQDMQAVGYLLAEIQNRDELKRIRGEVVTGKNSDGQMSLDADFAKRLESPLEQFKRLRIAISDLAMSVGEALLPPLTQIVTALQPMARAFADWAKEHPALIKGAVGIALGIVGIKAAVLSAAWAVNFFVASPVALLMSAWQAVAARVLIGRAALLAGAGPLRSLGMAAGLSGSAMVRLGAAFSALRSVATTALMAIGRAMLWLGRALIANPIGLAIAAIAGAAYLVWRNWDVIGPKLSAVWDSVKGALSSTWDWMKTAGSAVASAVKWAFLNMTPVGQVIQHWDAIKAGAARLLDGLMALPAEMLKLGQQIVSGLIDGIKAKIAAAGEAVAGLGESIKNTFKGWLGIRSPSRVFDGFGRMIGLGAAQGISGMGGAVAKATAGLALAATAAFQPALSAGAVDQYASPLAHQAVSPVRVPTAIEPIALPQLPQLPPVQRMIRDVVQPATLPQVGEAERLIRERLVPAQPEQVLAANPRGDASMPALHATRGNAPSGAAPGAMTISFAPVIHIQGHAGQSVADHVHDAVRLSFAEFERLMRRYEAERRRVAPMGGMS